VGRSCELHGEVRNSYTVLTGKPREKWPRGRYWHRYERFIMVLGGGGGEREREGMKVCRTN
jgi:hypothetical protein